jgi:hypothetical protein
MGSVGQDEIQAEPAGHVLDLAADGLGHGLGEGDILVDGVDSHRGCSRSCARTAMRRASSRESSWTAMTRG